MEPGKELDKLIAERVLGWVILLPGSDTQVGSFPPYSIDIAAAWQVVEGMIDVGYSVSVDYVEGWRCFMTQGGFGKSPVEAISAPLAICLAALKVFDMEVEDETGQGT